MIVQTAVVDDAPAIAALHVRAWQVAYAGTFPGGYLMTMDVASRTARRRELIDNAEPPEGIFVASDDGAICGFTHVSRARFEADEEIDPAVGEVHAIYVHPSHWSVGAGLALMRAGVAHLTDAGFAEIRLWVLDANPRARRFYERFGFIADGAAKTYTLDAGGPFETRARTVRYTLPVR